MSNRRFDPKAQAILQQNEHVLRVSDTTITYSLQFKVKAVRANLYEGESPVAIFIKAGFPVHLIGAETPKRCLKRWRKIFQQRGEEGLLQDLRGKQSTGRSVERELTLEEKLRRAEARVQYLEKEVELLKKLDAIEGSEVRQPAQKFELIRQMAALGRREFNIRYLCEVSGVSRSGYYRWLRSAADRAEREALDYAEHLPIRDIFLKKKRKAGWRVIKMLLERQGQIMNHKKIRRLMKKFELVTQIRRQNPYKHMAKATQEHRTAPNILARQFQQQSPYRVFNTDITYLYDGRGQRSYLSVLRDVASGEIISHVVAPSPTLHLGFAVIDQLVDKLGPERLIGTLIHSDQGFQYTHPMYTQRLSDLGIVQSMSRKGNCLDNAPIESFFGHLKDELDLSECTTLAEVRTAVDQYIHYYNYDRPQWERKKMAPVEYRNHLCAS